MFLQRQLGKANDPRTMQDAQTAMMRRLWSQQDATPMYGGNRGDAGMAQYGGGGMPGTSSMLLEGLIDGSQYGNAMRAMPQNVQQQLPPHNDYTDQVMIAKSPYVLL
jgi:hypothetical protein